MRSFVENHTYLIFYNVIYLYYMTALATEILPISRKLPPTFVCDQIYWKRICYLLAVLHRNIVRFMGNIVMLMLQNTSKSIAQILQQRSSEEENSSFSYNFFFLNLTKIIFEPKFTQPYIFSFDSFPFCS